MSGFSLEALDHSYLNKRYNKLGFNETVDPHHFLPLKLTSGRQDHDYLVAYGNTLRRILTHEVPILAFTPDKIQILSNVTQYHPDYIKDRLGLLVVHRDYETPLNALDYVFSLATSEGKPLINQTGALMKIYAHQHLIAQHKQTKEYLTQAKLIRLIPHNSLLLTLKPKEKIHLLMEVEEGLGKVHPRWQATITSYKYQDPSDQETKSTDPPNNSQQLSVREQPEALILTVESIGSIDSDQAVKQTLKELDKRIEWFKDQLIHYQTALDSHLQEEDPTVTLKVSGQDHTLGNLIKVAGLSVQREIGVDLLECLCTYRKPHPLDDYIEIMARVPDTFPLSEDYPDLPQSIRFLIMVCDRIIEDTPKFSDAP